MAWQIRGEYFETCSCDYLCPCPTSNLTARPTQGWCTFAFVQHIDQGHFDGVQLDGLNFAIIASGQAGGPMAPLAGLIGNFAGVEARSIRFDKDGLKRAASIPEMLDQALEGVAGANGSEPIYLDNVGHPVNTRLALAHGTASHVHAFGIDWDNTSGKNNGHFAPFDWRGGGGRRGDSPPGGG